MSLLSPPLKRAAVKCGFCNTGNHDRCAVNIRNGNGSIVLCPCCPNKPYRCLDCGHRSFDEVDEVTRVCIDRDACYDVRETRRAQSPVYEFLLAREAAAAQAEYQREARPAPPSVVARQPKDCRCGCGEKTGGGNFLPGHDSRYLKDLFDSLEGGGPDGRPLGDIYDELADLPKLLAKFKKRVEIDD